MGNIYFDGVSIRNQRPTNMDSLLLKERLIESSDVLLATICDGVGSLQDGAFAASRAVAMLDEWFDRISGTNRIGLRLRDRIMEINETISEDAQRGHLKTAATLSSLLLVDQQYYIVHVGDSRIYCYQNGQLLRLTRDHVSELGKLTSSIGHGQPIIPQYEEGFAGQSSFLLCSDGLYKRTTEEWMKEQISTLSRKNLRKKIDYMVDCAKSLGETDNITLAMIVFER